jgi:hypothetical protein
MVGKWLVSPKDPLRLKLWSAGLHCWEVVEPLGDGSSEGFLGRWGHELFVWTPSTLSRGLLGKRKAWRLPSLFLSTPVWDVTVCSHMNPCRDVSPSTILTSGHTNDPSATWSWALNLPNCELHKTCLSINQLTRVFHCSHAKLTNTAKSTVYVPVFKKLTAW